MLVISSGKLNVERMSRKLVNVRDYVLTPEMMSPGGGEIITVPDQTMSIKTILERSVQGLASPVGMEGSYYENADFDSPDMEKVAQMELEDRDQFSRDNLRRMSELNKKLKADQEAQRLQKVKDAEEERLMKEEFRKKRASGDQEKAQEQRRSKRSGTTEDSD